MIRPHRSASQLDLPTADLPAVDLSQLACVIVTFHPDLQVLAKELNALPTESAIVIVDNASESKVRQTLSELLAHRPRARIAANRKNLGLASACNQAVELIAREWSDIEFVLLLDQDSDPQPGAVTRLLQNLLYAQRHLDRLGCVGPQLIDTATGLPHGFHYIDRWTWRRAYPGTEETNPVFCHNLNGSGTMTSLRLYRNLNGLDKNLFIDHVDTDWAFRVLAHGGFLLGIPNALFSHRMGTSGRRLWMGRWRVWPVRTPQRHFFLYRNALWLLRRPYVPRVWKIWAIAKLGLTLAVTLAIGPQRGKQLGCMYSGIVKGLRPMRDD